jgi:hypothetical protein
MSTGTDDWSGPLRPVTTAVARLQSSLGALDLQEGVSAANEIAAGADHLLKRIRSSPGRHSERLAELAAALEVFRNAAYVFRRLSEKGEHDEVLTSTCGALIGQGQDHLRRFSET